jgi:hypothetical protein
VTETPLAGVPDWQDVYIERAASCGLTTAEQVVALSSTDRGTRSLSEQLGVSEETAAHLIDSAHSALPEATRLGLERPVDTREYGLGAVPPRDSDDAP